MAKFKVLFIHHSTGGLLLRFGHVRELLKDILPNVEFWDHGYNLDSAKILSYLFGIVTFKTGLSDGYGRMTGRDFNLIISNNSPREYAEIFSRDPKDFTLKNVLSFDVIIFKNCFPTSKIETKDKLDKYKKYYSQIIKSISKYSNMFIVFTPPPLRVEMTKPEWAHNARVLADWLTNQEKKNVKVFNFFDLLADKSGKNTDMLRREYCDSFFFDSHPNIRANREIGKIFVAFLASAIKNYEKP